MNLSTIPVVRSVIQQLLNYEVFHVVIAPGSRSAPITVGLTTHSGFTTYSIVDERSAAFFALGLAQQLQKPVAVLCTSGSALLNIYPAIAEAYYSQYPIVVLSADRPTYQIDIGNGQTIRQKGVFSKHIVSETTLLQDVTHNQAAIIESNTQILIDSKSTKEIERSQQAIEKKNNTNSKRYCLKCMHKGPVHINIPLEEPLYDFNEVSDFTPQQQQQLTSPHTKQHKDFEKKWNTSKRILIVVGTMPANRLNAKSISLLANDPRVVVLHEINSNISHDNFIAHIDRVIIHREKEKQPRHFSIIMP